MKIVYIFCVFFLMGCVNKTTPPSIIDAQKTMMNKSIIANYVKVDVFINSIYKKEVAILTKSLRKINRFYFGSSNDIKLVFVKKKYGGMAMAMPDDSILVTTLLLDAIDSFFNEDEVTAIMCHEVAHILNGDWSSRFRETYTTINYTLQFSDLIAPALSYSIGKATGSNHSYSDHVDVFNYMQMTGFMDSDTFKFNDCVEFSFNLLNGFPVEVEMEADSMALECLNGLDIDKEALEGVLDRLRVLPYINDNQLSTRINNIMEKK